MSREFDIIVYGATGFTGQLVAEYLGKSDEIKGKWAVAGRNEGKVQARMKEVGVDVPVVIADSTDEESLAAMARRTKLIISLVGPYTLYGEPLVKAAVEAGTAYVDLTGEAPFCAKMIKRYGRQALSTQSLIIHSCGFDSVPGDLSAFLAVQKLRAVAGKSSEVGKVRSAYTVKGGASGGTLASALAMLEGPAEDKQVLMNPYCLSPVQGSHSPMPTILASTLFQNKRVWGGFWIMDSHNSAIVRRTWGILESGDDAASKMMRYGAQFSYSEFMRMPALVAPFVSLTLLVGFAILALFPPARWALRRFGPQPGSGPSPEMQKNGWFRVETVAKTVDQAHAVKVEMRGKGDPGYAATAKLIAECALSIVLERDRLPPVARMGGFLTPASALGHVLVERLEKTGSFSFQTYTEEDKSK